MTEHDCGHIGIIETDGKGHGELVTLALELLSAMAIREDAYRAVNRQISALQGDFPAHLTPIDHVLSNKAVALIDAILGDTAGSYWLYEARNMKNGGKIVRNDGVEWPIVTIDDVGRYVRSTHGGA